jgi:RNA polymerase sigma-70 factor (ECF subfamily)
VVVIVIAGAERRRGSPAGSGPAVARLPDPDLHDAELVRRFGAGDEAALAALFRRHERLVLLLVRRYARSGDEARDLAQRTFVRALQAFRARRLRRGVPFRAWIVRVAVNLCRNHLRDARRRAPAPLEALGAAEARPPEALEELEREEREARVRAAVLELPPRQREVLALRLDAELTFADIAAALRIRETTARVTFHQALRALQARFAAEAP